MPQVSTVLPHTKELFPFIKKVSLSTLDVDYRHGSPTICHASEPLWRLYNEQEAIRRYRRPLSIGKTTLNTEIVDPNLDAPTARRELSNSQRPRHSHRQDPHQKIRRQRQHHSHRHPKHRSLQKQPHDRATAARLARARARRPDLRQSANEVSMDPACRCRGRFSEGGLEGGDE